MSLPLPYSFRERENVMQVYKKVFYKPKHNSPEKRTDGIFLVLAPSVIGIAVCALCLCGSSWAWFTSTTSAGTNTIKSATFQISDVQITKGSNVTPLTPGEDGEYTLSEGTYTLSFKASEENTSSKGYCCITVYKNGENAGTNYYTNNIGSGTYTVNVVNNESMSITVKIEPIWGDVTKKVTESESAKIIDSGNSITVGTVENSASNGLSNSKALTKQNSETTEQTTTPAQEAQNTASEDNAATTPETTAVETEEQKETTSVTTEGMTDTETTDETTATDNAAETTETPGTGEPDETDQ